MWVVLKGVNLVPLNKVESPKLVEAPCCASVDSWALVVV
jgi:hypothetical protein